MKERIYKVEKVQIKYAKIMPPKLVVIAEGVTRTSGWSEIELRPIGNKGGVYEFEMVGKPPKITSLPVLTEVGAMYVFDEIPQIFDGVIVYTETNSIAARSEKTDSNVENFEETDPIYVVERLKGISVKDDELTFRVYTGGCTSKENFQVEVSGFTGVSPWMVTLIRVKPDYCDGYFPEGVEITYSFKELGMEPNAWFNLGNEFQQ